MSSATPPSPLREIDYEALEAALAGTLRGRWFLAEYLRRNQPAEFASLREALHKIEKAVSAPPPAAANDRLRCDLIEMSEAITQARREIAAIKPAHQAENRSTDATGELDAIAAATEKATSDILEAAEDIQEVAWQLRERGIEEAACDRLDDRTTEIYTSCSFQDISGQRIEKIVEVLNFLEARVSTMIEIWGADHAGGAPDADRIEDQRPDAHLLSGPHPEGEGLDQGEIDAMIDPATADRAASRAKPAMATAEAQPADAVLAADELMAAPLAAERAEQEDGAAATGSTPTIDVLEVETLDPTKTQALFS